MIIGNSADATEGEFRRNVGSPPEGAGASADELDEKFKCGAHMIDTRGRPAGPKSAVHGGDDGTARDERYRGGDRDGHRLRRLRWSAALGVADRVLLLESGLRGVTIDGCAEIRGRTAAPHEGSPPARCGKRRRSLRDAVIDEIVAEPHGERTQPRETRDVHRRYAYLESCEVQAES